MVRAPIPLVVDECFFLSGSAEDAISLSVDSPAWHSWLADTQHHSFSLRCSTGSFTARHEQQRHGWYWYAYRKHAGKAYKMYLGKAEDVTTKRMCEVAESLAKKGPAREAPATPPSLFLPEYILPFHLRAMKFSVPAIDTPVVQRSRLLSLLESGRRSKLTLLSAQAGWGKTVLLANWCSQLSKQALPFAWISLDAADNEPVTFWSSFITALQTVQSSIGKKALSLLHGTASAAALDQALQALLDECMTLSQETIIFLDDGHHLLSSELYRSLALFLERAPAQLHIVLSTRVDPALPLAKLRVQGKLLELRGGELAFTQDEIAAFLHETLHLTLSQHEYALLAQKTEGWAAGIHLAALALKDQANVAQSLQLFSGSTRSVFDYIVEEVLLHQSVAVQDFLLQTSILPRLSSSLCDAVCDSQNSQALLEYLRLHNLFLVPLDTQGLHYRYHPLFQEALQARLRQQAPLLESSLHHRAAVWYEQHSTSGSRKHMQQEHWSEQWPMPQRMSTRIPDLHADLLTERERDVLALLLHGASNREIAQRLIISEGTTKKHIANICSKFNVQRRTQVITRVFEHAAY